MEGSKTERKKPRKARPKKRKFCGNKHTGSLKTETSIGAQKRPANSSFSKLGQSLKKRPKIVDEIQGYRIVDVSFFVNFLMKLSCPSCDSCFLISEKLFGLASCFTVKCSNELCGFSENFETSSKLHQKKGKSYAINRQFPLAMCAIGRHHQHLVRLATNLDMPPPLSEVSWREHVKEITRVTRTVAECSMRRAANQVKSAGEPVTDITVSCDNTWQKRDLPRRMEFRLY